FPKTVNFVGIPHINTVLFKINHSVIIAKISPKKFFDFFASKSLTKGNAYIIIKVSKIKIIKGGNFYDESKQVSV
ncbi:hypothetical protein ABWL48_15060, partial [Streptococcus suis]